MPQIKVEIGGRSYRMACAEGQEAALEKLASQVDEKIEELRGTTGEIGDTRLAVMAAIMLADERNEARAQLDGAETLASSGTLEAQDIAARLTETEARATAALEDAAVRVEALARQIGEN